MCGRFSFFARRSDVAKAFPFVRLPANFDALNPPRYNIAPTQTILTISSEAPDELTQMHWGLVPYWAKDRSIGNRMINVRREHCRETCVQKRVPQWPALSRTRRRLLRVGHNR